MRHFYTRLLLWFCAANVVTLLVSVFVTQQISRRSYVTAPDWAALAQAANAAYEHGGTAALDDWRESHHREGVFATLFEDGRDLLPGPLPPPLERQLPKLLAEDSVVLRPRPELIVAGEIVTGADGVVRHLIGLRAPRRPPPIGELLVVQIALSLLVIGGLGWIAARGISRPVAALQAATRRMAEGELSARVGAQWTRQPDELGRLAADFDRMAARIEALVAQERSVLQDVSHELRSPLARLHLLLDLVRRTPPAEAAPYFERAEAEIARLDRIIGETLALARLEGGLPGMQAETVALDALVGARLAAARLEADARRVVLATTTLTPQAVRGSAALLERAFDNLLSNAIKFSPEGGRVEVALCVDGDAVELSLRDEGPGVPEVELEALFRPFFRGSNGAAADGHGLGLAIVRRIALAHGGSVRAENVAPHGLRVALRLSADRMPVHPIPPPEVPR